MWSLLAQHRHARRHPEVLWNLIIGLDSRRAQVGVTLCREFLAGLAGFFAAAHDLAQAAGYAGGPAVVPVCSVFG